MRKHTYVPLDLSDDCGLRDFSVAQLRVISCPLLYASAAWLTKYGGSACGSRERMMQFSETNAEVGRQAAYGVSIAYNRDVFDAASICLFFPCYKHR